jgi:hypothetical protein
LPGTVLVRLLAWNPLVAQRVFAALLCRPTSVGTLHSFGLGDGLGLGEVAALGAGDTPGLGLGAGLGSGLGLGEGLGLGLGLGDGATPPTGARMNPVADEPSENVPPKNCAMSGVKKVNGSDTATTTWLPRPEAGAALQATTVGGVVDGSLHVTVMAMLPSPLCDWAFVSCSACAAIPSIPLRSVGLVIAYAAPSRAAFVTWMYVNMTRPKSTAIRSRSARTGMTNASSTNA